MNSTSEQQDAQHLRMTTAPVPGLILSLSVPSIITCIITSVYNMADTFFVAQLGTAAVAAVGVVFSISSVLSALGFWMGTGGSSLVSLYLGAREKEKAHCAASTGFFLALGLGGVIAAGGLLALEPLMRLLGSTDTILPEAEAYAVPILLAAPFQCSSLALAQCLRAEGKSKESMAGQLAGGLLNIVLDPLFIYTLGMGIRGAGAATALSQVMVWAALLWFYVRGKTSVRISVRCRPSPHPADGEADFHHRLSQPVPSPAATRWPPSCSTAQRAALETLPSPRSASHPASRGWRSPCPSALCRGFSPWPATPTAAKTTRG